MQNYVLSLEGQFPSIYSASKLTGSAAVAPTASTNGNSLTSSGSTSASASGSHSSSISNLSNTSTSATVNSTTTTVTSDEILPNKLPLKRRLSEFRFGRDGGSLSIGKKTVSTFMTNPFAFDKFKDITTAFTVHLHDDGVILDPGSVGPLPYSHPSVLHLLNSINTGSLPVELFLTLLEQSVLTQQQLFYDGCVVVGVVEWRDGMTLTIGNLAGGNTSRQINGQWTRRVISNTLTSSSTTSQSSTTPESHKVLLKPTPDCWQYALSFFASLGGEGKKYARILEDEEKLLEFERQLILINEPTVCLDPSPMVMYAMNALYFDHYKQRLFQPLVRPAEPQVFDELDQTLLNLAAIKPAVMDNLAVSPTQGTATSAISPKSPTINPRYRRITLIESFHDRERRRRTEPIYGIDHRRQFVKNRQALPPSTHVPANWRPFKTIRYEREINSKSVGISGLSGGISGLSSNVSTTSTSTAVPSSSTSTVSSTSSNPANSSSSSNSLAKLYYCVNVFYAPPPTFPPIQLFLQVGTTPDTSTSGFLHRLQFTNLIETENYLQNLRNLLLIENGNCNLKVITDISTTTASVGSASNPVNTGNTGTVNGINSQQAQLRKPLHSSPQISALQQPTTAQPPVQQYQLTPHQILQLNQQRNPSKDRLPTTQPPPPSNPNINTQFNKY